MSARLFRYAAGAGVYCAGVGLAYELASPQPDLPSEQSRCSCFKQLSPSYDDEVDATERSNGILDLRESMVSQARGRTLEVAAGTARNLEYYRKSKATELVIADYCEEMLRVAARKVAEYNNNNGSTRAGESAAPDGAAACTDSCCSKSGGPSSVTLAVVDASAMPFADGSYDTVVDSFGICSFEKPVEVTPHPGPRASPCAPFFYLLLATHARILPAPQRYPGAERDGAVRQ